MQESVCKKIITLFSIIGLLFLAGCYPTTDVEFKGVTDASNLRDVNVAGNITVATGGQMYFNVTREYQFNVQSFRQPTANFPATGTVGTFPTLAFDDSTNESSYALGHVSDDYSAGSNISIGFYWVPPTTEVDGVVKWCVEFLAAKENNNEVINGTTSTVCLDAYSQGLANELLDGEIEVDGSSLEIDDVMGFRIHRGADLAADNFTGDAKLLSVTVYYDATQLGTLN